MFLFLSFLSLLFYFSPFVRLLLSVFCHVVDHKQNVGSTVNLTVLNIQFSVILNLGKQIIPSNVRSGVFIKSGSYFGCLEEKE
jgi:hypothetical protein